MTKICLSCGKQFEAKRNTAKFCSAKCRVYASRRKAEHLERDVSNPLPTPEHWQKGPSNDEIREVAKLLEEAPVPTQNRYVQTPQGVVGPISLEPKKLNNPFQCQKCGSIKVAGKCLSCKGG